MRFGTLVVKNLVRRPLRSALTAAAIAVAIGAVVALVGVAGGFEKTFLRLYESTNVDIIVVQTRGKQQQLAGTLDEALGDKIAQIPGVKTILTSLSDMVAIEEAGSMGVVMQGWPPESANFQHIHVAKGRTLTKADTKHVLLGSILARNLEKGVGDSVELLEKERFEVVGVFETDNTFQNGSLVVPLSELQRLMSKPGQVTGFSVCLTDPNDKALLKDVCQKIEALGKRITASPTREHVETITEIKVAKGMAWLTSTIALVIGLFGLTNTAVMSVSERTKELGILRAVGWRPGRVVRMIVAESVLLSTVGAVMGTVGAIVGVKLLTRVPAVSGLIEGRIEWPLVGLGFVIAIGIGLLGSLIPARRVVRMAPVEALRHE